MNMNLLDILSCPVCKGRVEYHKNTAEIQCPRCQKAYPIVDDIPVMIQEQARIITREESENPR
jgi:uncharacterized protein YbaR (Trm112 family)